MSVIKQASIAKFKGKDALIGIVGLGYVGLPLMLRYNAIGYRVLGIDIDEGKVASLNAGKSYIEHIPAQSIAAARNSGFEATTDFKRVAECDALILCVPTPLNKYREPDMRSAAVKCTVTVTTVSPWLSASHRCAPLHRSSFMTAPTSPRRSPTSWHCARKSVFASQKRASREFASAGHHHRRAKRLGQGYGRRAAGP